MTMGPSVGSYTGVLALYFLFTGWIIPVIGQELELFNVTTDGKLGETTNITCTAFPPNVQIEWLFQGSPLNKTDRINITTDNVTVTGNEPENSARNITFSTVIIPNATHDDTGEFTCVAKLGDKNKTSVWILDLGYFEGKLVNHTPSPHKENAIEKATVTLECVFEVYKPTIVKWYKSSKGKTEFIAYDNQTVPISPKQVKSEYTFNITGTNDDGTYTCQMEDSESEVLSKNITGYIDVHVYDHPEITIDKAVAINTTQIYLHWAVETHHSEIVNYTLSTNEIESKSGYVFFSKEIRDKNATSFVIDGLKNSTKYKVKLQVCTTYNGQCKASESGIVETLDSEPVFVPNISINGFSATSVTIGWDSPPAKIEPLIHYYILVARRKDKNVTRTAYHSRDERNLPYMFDSLEPHSTYVFQVRACSDFTKSCGDWSKEMEAATLDGIPDAPSDVSVNCSASYLTLAWRPPKQPKAEIKGYIMEIVGNATYKDRYGNEKVATWGPLSKFMTNDSMSVSEAANFYSMRVNDLQPNTNYTVRFSAMTRTRRRGEEHVTRCATRSAAPDSPPRPRWRKILEKDKYMFKMYLPRISERNGRICCYRIYIIRMPPHATLASLPLANQIEVTDYASVHGTEPVVKAYIADVFSNDYFPPDSELIIGDEISRYNLSRDQFLERDECSRCVERPPRQRTEPPPLTTTTTTTESPEDDPDDYRTEDPIIILSTDAPARKRRFYIDNDEFSNSPMMLDSPQRVVEEERKLVYDGPLDSNSNYTLFVELIPGLADEEPLFSDYTSVLMPAPSPPIVVPSTPVEIALQVTCAVAAVILLLMIIFCIMQSRRSRKMPPHGHLEMNSIPAIIRHVVGGICGRQQLTTVVPPEKPPIAKEDLAEAYAKRQVDSDYGFQKEFELLQMLPEYFPDRTTHASEARENQPKNRYPDIKAYDQTRVKLAQVDGISGSDYINANFVMGYQERKQFICAQGPTDTTVNDFWRMIWEHGLELIVMLTNLEEYSKVKCSKYWPEERGARAFGNITVHHVGEKRYSDYIVRELKITKQPLNSDGQPIVENNGISKGNGDVKDAESSVPTSPRECKETESRLVRQYHFLMWKDFAAPEQPHTILKFIKRVNEAWASMVGRPIVVHCSAGVGRTGTLVALDCLIQQLQTTGQVTIFNTIAELRRQRNFLVQSLKQYVFVYRALVEYAHFGDTEISAGRLKPAVDRLRNISEGAVKCLMEDEFEKILNSPIGEPIKSCAAGAGDELRTRNRSADCLPYDRNRVILTPLPGRDYSTYINASFIEAYDNTEGFIITQDPLAATLADFWRMAAEHNVSTVVMLSELGDGKCPRYWDDNVIQYEHISVQYEESESCPYYTRRQFIVTNEKSGEVNSVRQLQYQGWPTAPGHVPEVTRGLAELADAAAPNQAHHGTMLVHCQFGTERSPLFVALCTLIRQLRTERRVDVSAISRAVRHQRARTIDTFLQYEFLYRAILNYAELHNLLEDS